MAYVARKDLVHVEELDGGLVIYDSRSGQAHLLDAASAAVWRACADSIDETQIAAGAGLSTESCRAILARLVALDLVVATQVAGVSRRAMLHTAAKVGIGGAAAAPILSVIIPAAAAHASTGSGGNGGNGGNPPGANSFVVQSGAIGSPGDPDPGTVVQVNYPGAPVSPPPGGGSPAFIVAPNGAWVAPAGTSQWVSYIPNGGSDGADGYYYYTCTQPIVIPAGAVSPQITGLFSTDNSGQVYVNGVQVASDGDTAYGTLTSFSSGLIAGQDNVLQFAVVNGDPNSGSTSGDPTGLDYYATVSWS